MKKYRIDLEQEKQVLQNCVSSLKQRPPDDPETAFSIVGTLCSPLRCVDAPFYDRLVDQYLGLPARVHVRGAPGTLRAEVTQPVSDAPETLIDPYRLEKLPRPARTTGHKRQLHVPSDVQPSKPAS
jgi:hypothetical protein